VHICEVTLFNDMTCRFSSGTARDRKPRH